jgi:uncharacterized protein YdeI (YjbR/CyaY-like superfamily)
MERSIPDLKKALSANEAAELKWKDLTPIARRDFMSWIESAKQAETRARRIGKACSMLLAGKRRPCCYSVVPMELYTQLGKNKKAKATWSTLSSDERRDFTDWIEAAKDSKLHEKRIKKVCATLAIGKKHF